MNKRVLAAAIAILIVGAGIFAFSARNMKSTESISTSEKVFIDVPDSIKLAALDFYRTDNKTYIPKDLYIKYYPDGEGYYIVQFVGPIYEEYKNKVVNSGGKLYDYAPEDAFIVKMNESAENKVQNLDIVKWVGIYQSAYKFMPDLLNESSRLVLNVLIFDGGDAAEIAKNIETIGGMVSISSDKIRVNIEPSKIPEIAKIKGVEYIEEYNVPEIG